MSTCVFAGTFDPFTIGHLSAVKRLSAMFGCVIVAVADNAAKNPVLKAQQRLALVEKCCCKLKNVEIKVCEGLLSDFCLEFGANCIVKGVRNSADFDYENEMFKANLALSGIETLLLPSVPELSFVSSSLIKELLGLDKDISKLVPKEIHNDIAAGYSLKRKK